MFWSSWWRTSGSRANSVAAFLSKIGVFTTGSVFFVSSDVGNANNTGSDPVDDALATIDAAIGKCTADKGDVIIVLPGHTETVAGAAGIDCDVAGVTIVGVGHGASRPTITLSAVASTVELAAASVTLRNLLFLVSADVTVAIDVNAADCLIEDCEMRNSATKEAVTWIDINGGAANACDRTTIRNCVIKCPAVGTTGGIELGEIADNVVIEGCYIDGDFGDACIHNPTGFVLTKLRVARCVLRNTQTGDHAIELVSACTGTLAYNEYYSDITQATASDPGSCFSIECYHDDVVDASGIVSPAVT